MDASVVNGKGKKVIVFKYKPKKGYCRKQGHRQPYTKVTIGKISCKMTAAPFTWRKSALWASPCRATVATPMRKRYYLRRSRSAVRLTECAVNDVLGLGHRSRCGSDASSP